MKDIPCYSSQGYETKPKTVGAGDSSESGNVAGVNPTEEKNAVSECNPPHGFFGEDFLNIFLISTIGTKSIRR